MRLLRFRPQAIIQRNARPVIRENPRPVSGDTLSPCTRRTRSTRRDAAALAS